MTHEENKMRYRTIVNDKVVYESYFACVFHRSVSYTHLTLTTTR